ncbi:hypothetical protein F4813DRAFT_399512 [Daldinia decipiens]|uniref:uncharacterized protein n=1 Tax=Daldinia decipiens TaxID=326647 RepID=UPI0020C26A6E|nr:uncharacterized protein F4813DRAFT_399512 [Daldinia decipiens]KAI1653975.1 hypothetical protein F4813DRAFT_399512 [Daldinia decipiens]
MDGTAVSVVQPVPTLVNSPSVHRSTSTGVTPIDQTSWKPKKRSRITSSPSPTNYNPSPTPPSSRITKTNNSKQYGSKPSPSPSLSLSPSPSSLTKPSPKRRRTAAGVVTSVAAAVTATSDDLRHHPPDTNWGYSIPSGPLNYGIEPIISNATRDHFSLSPTTLTQEQGLEGYNWNGNNSAQLTSSSSSLPSVSSPLLPYLTTQEPASYNNFPRSYLADYTGLTTPSYPVYSFLPPWNPVKTPGMLVEYRPRLDGGSSIPERRPPGSSPLIPEERDEKSLIEPIDEGWIDLGLSVKKDSASHHDGSPQVSDLSGKSTPILEEEEKEEEKEEEEELWESVIEDDAAIDGNCPVSHPERRSQSHLSDQNRKETGSTRKLKCKADPKNPRGVDCLTCRNIKLDSKKVIHRLPCLRWKLADVALFREGGLDLTKRWSGTRMKDLGPRDWVNSNDVRTIKMIMGSRHPMVLRVKKFTPIDGDVICKYWVDKKGEKQKIDIEPYALASIWETAKRYEEYIYDYAHPAVREYSQDRQVDTLVRRTYRAAIEYAQKCKNTSVESGSENMKNAVLLEQYFYLWFATRNTLRSAFIVGEETLDMKAIDNPECPYHGTISIPRMIPAQFDSLGQRVLVQLRKFVLEGLWRVMAGKNPHHFYFVYLIVFMLLHEVSFTSADRLRRAKDNKYTEYRYDLAKFVEGLQEGANNILSHWHYYKRDVNTLMTEMESEDRKNTVWGTLNPGEVKLLIETREAYGKVAGKKLEWEHDLYFVSQMFEENWHPRKTFSR